MMAPRYSRIIKWDPAATNRDAMILIISRTRLSIWIICCCTCYNIALTKPSVTWMSIERLWTTIRTFFITRTIDCTFVMFDPTISHALCIMITSSDALINVGITNVFTFQFIIWISKIFVYFCSNQVLDLRAIVCWWFGRHCCWQCCRCPRDNLMQIWKKVQ